MIIDLHCDTFIRMYNAKENADVLESNDYHIDIDKLKRGGVYAQCFAIYNNKGEEYRTKDMYDRIGYMFEGLDKYSDDFYLYSGYEDMLSHKCNSNKICAIPTIEDLGPITGDISHIDRLHEMGFKILSLTWNYENSLGYPNSRNADIMGKGLKDFGIEVIHKMNCNNMIIDVSHLSDGGFYDVAKHSRKPFAATHSNSRALSDSTRNLTDEMIRVLSDAGGITGINFCSEFLEKGSRRSTVEDIIRHIKYIKNIGGIDCIAIGSDYDGINCELELYDASAYPLLIDELSKAGFTQSEIEKITYKNALRLLKDSEQGN